MKDTVLETKLQLIVSFEWLIGKYLIHGNNHGVWVYWKWQTLSRSKKRIFYNISCHCNAERNLLQKLEFLLCFLRHHHPESLCRIKRVFNCLYLILCYVKLYTSFCVCVAIDIFLHRFHMLAFYWWDSTNPFNDLIHWHTKALNGIKKQQLQLVGYIKRTHWKSSYL